eukprot:CAMPEP_0115839180 /NCGR_PEP_ID=MMETSP0287-20121206/6119_1 /TAXON_ID=412157 /ORGANISM="Chrysochromulina rotalis, Strain UIO044" /LENGTH=74 /DNA_ID=CAMNT_0003292745 /DNA_START=537 /DNA_END=762 /DNA_ORIENTATION=+
MVNSITSTPAVQEDGRFDQGATHKVFGLHQGLGENVPQRAKWPKVQPATESQRALLAKDELAADVEYPEPEHKL